MTYPASLFPTRLQLMLEHDRSSGTQKYIFGVDLLALFPSHSLGILLYSSALLPKGLSSTLPHVGPNCLPIK